MQTLKFFLGSVAMFLWIAFLLQDKPVWQLRGGALVILLACLSAAVVAIAIYAYKNRKELSEVAGGNYESLSKLLYSRKKRRRE